MITTTTTTTETKTPFETIKICSLKVNQLFINFIQSKRKRNVKKRKSECV